MNPENTPNTTSAGPNKLMGILAYLGILIIIPFLIARKDTFVKFHIQQALVLFVIEAIIWFIGQAVGPSAWMIISIANLAVFIFAILGIINVVNGNQKELPIVGVYSKYFSF